MYERFSSFGRIFKYNPFINKTNDEEVHQYQGFHPDDACRQSPTLRLPQLALQARIGSLQTRANLPLHHQNQNEKEEASPLLTRFPPSNSLRQEGNRSPEKPVELAERMAAGGEPAAAENEDNGDKTEEEGA